MNAGRGLFGDAADLSNDTMKALRIAFERALKLRIQRNFFFIVRLFVENFRVFLGLVPEQYEQGRIAAVIEDHVRTATIAPLENAIGVCPIFRDGFAFDRKNRGSSFRNRGRSVVLCRENITTRPTHFGAKFLQRFDQHRGLDRHV